MAAFFASPSGARIKGISVIATLTLILTACATDSGSGGGGGGGGPAPTATLSVAPGLISPGQGSQLTFTSTNGRQGSIDGDVGPVGLNGSTIVTPTTTTTYIYTVTGPGGAATASATVNVLDSFDAMVQSDGTTDEDVDPNGAVGKKQYMEYVNTAYQAYDKVTHATVWSSAQQVKTLWQGSTTTHCFEGFNGKSAIQLDVVINYDRLASRWVVGAKRTNPNYFCLAVSYSDDLATTQWNTYEYPLPSELLGGGTLFPDWPKLGTWTDTTKAQSAYYATLDLEDLGAHDDEVGALVCAFDRETILLNNPATPLRAACNNVSQLDSTRLQSGNPPLFLAHSLIPADVEGTTVPPAGRHEFMISIQNPINDLMTLTSTSINLWDFQVDWSQSAPTLMATVVPLTVDEFTPGCYLYAADNPAITNCVQEPQSDGQQLVDSVGDRMMPRLSYRNFGSYESYLISHTIQTGPGASGTTPSAYQTGIRWYELRDNGSGDPSIFQSGTINPDNKFFRFLPSIDQDKVGNAAMGYSLSNSFLFPEIDFSYWNLNATADPIETTIVPGGGEEISGGSGVGKWGSYSSMTVDPVDDCTFWYVNEYFDANNTWRTRIANFKVPGC